MSCLRWAPAALALLALATLAAGCNGYFEKPIDPLNILEEIHKITGRKK